VNPADTLPPGLADYPDYEIKRELGRGGMGVVYLAHNTLMGRDEVLKVMGRHIIERPGVLDRFLREIQAVARLRHPNIVMAYRAMRLDGSVVLAMEYVKGFDLSKTVKSAGPLAVDHACYFVHQAALGLQHAHEEGLVHRDIKPGNLMLSRTKDKATIKVLDFGLAKATREEKVDVKLTSEGQALGTPDFIAPEQIVDARTADIRADIYSLGGTLYHLLAGHPPFQARSLYDIYQAHMSQDAEPLNFVRTEVPIELAALVSKMMAKDPARRFQTPDEVARALVPFFKKRNATFEDRRTDEPPTALSTIGQHTVGPVPAPTQPAPASEGPGIPNQKMSGTAVPGVRWESLIELRETERSTEPAPVVAAVPNFAWRSRPITIAASVIGLIVLSVIIIAMRSTNGKPRVTTDHDLTDRSGPSSSTASTLKKRPADGPLAPLNAEPLSVITNTIDMKFALMPTGEFMMGSDASDPETDDQEFLDIASGRKEKHRVRITRPFYMGIHEVTRGQFRRFVDDAGHQTEAEKPGAGGWGWNEARKAWEDNPRYNWRTPGFDQTDEHPVVIVSWNDARAFISWLSRKEGKTYRLPTEAEWEYACRAGSNTRYSCGDDAEGLATVGNVADATGRAKYPGWTWAITAHDGDVYTAPVGRHFPNLWGLYDMHGNVWEWCADGYADNYYQQSPLQDPRGVDGSLFRVIRGGGWHYFPRRARSASRYRSRPESRHYDLGFRVALDQSAR
jgi:formylglycine-generating enzyme required for sulfatase activity